MGRSASERALRRFTLGFASLISTAGLVAVFGGSTAGAVPQQISCPSGSPPDSFCGQFGPGEQAPSGGEQIDCPSGAPEGSTCYRYSGGPGGQPPGGSGPPGGSQPPGGSGGPGCSTQQGPLEIKSITSEGKELDGICAFLMTQTMPIPGGGSALQATISLAKKSPFSQDISSEVEPGTPIEISLTMSDPQPHTVVGTLKDAEAKFDGADLGVVGIAQQVEWSYSSGPGGPDCSSTAKMVFVGLAIMGTPSGSGPLVDALLASKGMQFFTNAQQFSPPFFSSGGSASARSATAFASAGAEPEVNLEISGCGDNGFAQGVVPTPGVDEMGLDGKAFDQLPEAAMPDTFMVDDNGDSVNPSEVDLEKLNEELIVDANDKPSDLPTGVELDYEEFSYSAHKITVSVNRKNARVANKCVKRKGKLKVKKRGGKRKLVCIKKKRTR